MRKYIAQRVFWLAVGSVFLLACVFSTSSTTVRGRVRDGDGRPIAGAEVRLGGTGNEARTTTQADSSYTVTAQHRPTQMLTLTVSKPGFATHTQQFPGFAAPEGNHDVELESPMQIIPRTRDD